MRMALTEAELAIPHGDVPVGAIVVVDGKITRGTTSDSSPPTRPPTPRSSRRDACEKLGTWRLDNAELIVTLEPAQCVLGHS